MPSSGVQTCALDRKSTRLNSSHGSISYAAVSLDRKSTRLNSSHGSISYAVFCLKKKQRQPATGCAPAIDTHPTFGSLARRRRGLDRAHSGGVRARSAPVSCSFFLFFFNDTATTEIYTLSLHDALPICRARSSRSRRAPAGWTCTRAGGGDRKSTRLNSSHGSISYAVFCLKKKNIHGQNFHVFFVIWYLLSAQQLCYRYVEGYSAVTCPCGVFARCCVFNCFVFFFNERPAPEDFSFSQSGLLRI